MRYESLRQGKEYDRKVIEEYETFFNSRSWDWWRIKRAEYTIKFLQEKEARVLEIGCGIGFVAEYLAHKPEIKEIIGIDTSRLAIEEARKVYSSLHSYKVKYIVGDFFDLKADDSFDLIYLHQVFEHLDAPEEAIAKIHTMLHMKGKVVISTPNRLRFSNRLLQIMGKAPAVIDPFHIREYSFPEIRNLLIKQGFRIVDQSMVGLNVPLLWKVNRISSWLNKSPVTELARTKLSFCAGKLSKNLASEILVRAEKL